MTEVAVLEPPIIRGRAVKMTSFLKDVKMIALHVVAAAIQSTSLRSHTYGNGFIGLPVYAAKPVSASHAMCSVVLAFVATIVVMKMEAWERTAETDVKIVAAPAGGGAANCGAAARRKTPALLRGVLTRAVAGSWSVFSPSGTPSISQ